MFLNLIQEPPFMPISGKYITWTPVTSRKLNPCSRKVALLSGNVESTCRKVTPYFPEFNLSFLEVWVTCRKVDDEKELVGKLNVSCRNVDSYFPWSYFYFPWSRETESRPTYRKVKLTFRKVYYIFIFEHSEYQKTFQDFSSWNQR